MKNKKPTTQINLMIRVIAAMYLIYLAHGLISGLDTAPNPRLMAGVAILFTFAGVLIIAFVIKAFINKEYTDVRDVDESTAGDVSAASVDEAVSEGSASEGSESIEEGGPEGTMIDESVTDDGVENNKGSDTDSKDEQ
ncbi:MAG: hypothetical protein K5857_07975 [Lachnospiraceae bacterium]|nr:hypothetical protein [Lachnospiraceae bacterium]